MNNDLISRSALRKAFHERIWYFTKSSWDEANALIDNAPSVEEKSCAMGYQDGCEDGLQGIRPKGEWVHLHAIGDYKCSICGAENLYKYVNEHERWIKTNSNFCPNCGADMQKGGAE